MEAGLDTLRLYKRTRTRFIDSHTYGILCAGEFTIDTMTLRIVALIEI